MLSRVAESIYWINRYIERAENYSRLIDVNCQMSLDLPNSHLSQWSPIVHTTSDQKTFVERYGEFNRKNTIEFITFDLDNPNSILSCISRARENARTVREQISPELWEILNEFYLKLKYTKQEHFSYDEVQTFFKEVRQNCLLFHGCMDATISHDTEVWNFAMLGRLLERADKSTRILDMKYYILLPSINDIGTSIDLIQWIALLKATGSLGMFKKSYSKINPKAISEFIMLNEYFPRSILFCMKQIKQNLQGISPGGTNVLNLVDTTLAELKATNVELIFTTGLHEYLDNMQIKLNQIDGEINQNYFL
ncbi:MAG: alpha-E domain-containing protein [Spirochaetota bacterium]